MTACEKIVSLAWSCHPLPHLAARVLFAAVAGTTPACTSDYPTAANQPPRSAETLWSPKEVTTVLARAIPVERKVTVFGSLTAYDQATLSVKVPGRLHALPVDFGSAVEHEQLVAQIERRDYQLRLDQAQAALAQARARLGLPLTGMNDQVDPKQTGTVREARAVLDEALKKRSVSRRW